VIGVFVKYFALLILAIYVFVWLFSPYLVRHFAQPVLQNLGVSMSAESTIRFNPFTSTLSINELILVDVNNVETLAVKEAEVSLHLHRLVNKQLYISEFVFKDASLRVEKTPETLLIAGIDLSGSNQTQEAPEPENPEASPLDYVVVLPKLQVVNFTADAYVDGLQQKVLVEDLLISAAQLSQSEQVLQLSLIAQINGAPLNINSSLAMKDGSGQVDSKFSLEKFTLESISPLLADLGAQMSGALSVSGAANVQVTQQAIKILSEQTTLSVDSLNFAYPPWIAEGQKDTITLTDLKLEAGIQGAINSLSTTINTQFEGNNLALDTSNNSLVNWQKMNSTTKLKLLDMQPSIAVDTLGIESLQLSNNKHVIDSKPLVDINQLLVSDIKFSERTLSVDTVSLYGLQTDITVNEDKSIAGLVNTSSLQVAENKTNDTEGDSTVGEIGEIPTSIVNEQNVAEQAMVILLQKFELLDGAIININDTSVSPAFEQKIIIETLQIGPFNSADPSLKSPFEVVAKDDDFLQIAADGYVMVFAEKLNASFNGKINEINLPSVSSYVKGALGFEMKSGQLDIGFGVDITNDELSGKTGLFLRGLEMSRADEFEQGTIKDGKAMPLNAALNMLKDEQGNIDLTVPIRGDISNPKFGLESFLGLILKKAAMSQAKDYLLATFVPYAQVLSVALTGAEYLLKVRFEPLILHPMQSSLDEANQQYLAQLVLLMQDKAELQLKTCAVSTLADLGATESIPLTPEQVTQLKELGSVRQTSLKRYLVTQGIASSRVLYCAPELDRAVGALPRVELKTD
jgi:hypothetical protein